MSLQYIFTYLPIHVVSVTDAASPSRPFNLLVLPKLVHSCGVRLFAVPALLMFCLATNLAWLALLVLRAKGKNTTTKEHLTVMLVSLMASEKQGCTRSAALPLLISSRGDLHRSSSVIAKG